MAQEESFPDGQAFDTISCSILIRSSDHDDIFEIIPSLFVRRSLKITREDASSIRVAALMLALRTAVEFDHLALENAMLTDIINGVYHSPNSVKVSTTRVPDFNGERFKAHGTCHVSLGDLSKLYLAVDNNRVKHSSLYSPGEILSAFEHSSADGFFAKHAAMGVTPRSNFSIIFTIRPDPSTTGFLLSSPIGGHLRRSFSVSSLSSDPMSSDDTFAYLTSAYSVDSAPPSIDTSDASVYPALAFQPGSIHCAGNEPTNLTGVPHLDHSPSSNTHSYSSPHPGTPSPVANRTRAGSLSHRAIKETLQLLLSTRTPPLESSALFAAERLKEPRGPGSIKLLDMIQNFTAVQNLLVAFGLEATKVEVVFTDPAGQDHKLSGETVLRGLGWPFQTFKNKSEIYLRATKAAKMDWKGAVPTGPAELALYRNWQGIVYMWSALGPVFTGQPPEANPDERYAAALVQTAVDKSSTEKCCETYLQDKSSD
ncbi:hypothetical protein B0H16DRAFT_1705915 [Mycena metata]|uniref:Uncharacterized protein n=1 Tax=Mycena metata TaxID=1033252 RepID=A0AAD7GK62_9AGAR|nr:hypothetical protein B0H16DRAFT_1705915 [Mycena metata]